MFIKYGDILADFYNEIFFSVHPELKPKQHKLTDKDFPPLKD